MARRAIAPPPVLPGMFDQPASIELEPLAAVPVAPQAVMLAPTVREARASGRQVARASASMLAYRDALIRLGPATDEQVAEALGWRVSSCCGRRGDWNDRQPLDRPAVEAVDRVRVREASQTRWRWALACDSDVCAVRTRDGVACPPDSCDIEDGIR